MKTSLITIVLFTILNISFSQTNTDLGQNAGNSGSHNTSIGYHSGSSVTGSCNTFTGSGSGEKTNDGIYNSFFGFYSGTYNVGGSMNSFVGSFAGANNTSGSSNIFVGYQSGMQNTTGNSNIYIGENSGYHNVTGDFNTLIGNEAGFNNRNNGNTFIGNKSGFNNSDGFYNTFIGNQSGYYNSVGSGNSFLGYKAGYNNNTGKYNTYIGDNAGYSNDLGSYNVNIGYRAGNNNKGSRNVFIGRSAGYYETGDNNLYIENSSSRSPLIYGNFSSNRVGINKNTPAYSLDVNGTFRCTGNGYVNGNLLISSDKSFKSNIKPIDNALEIITGITGVSYEFRTEQAGKDYQFPKGTQFGFLAQDLEEIIPEAVKEDADGYLAVNYISVIPLLVEALKEQQDQINEQRERIENLTKLISDDKSSSTETIDLSSAASIDQNIPNPFSDQTVINCFIPKSAENASLRVYNLDGELIKMYNIKSRENCEIKIRSNDLNPGTYIYTLVIDDKQKCSKSMIVIR